MNSVGMNNMNIANNISIFIDSAAINNIFND